LQGLRTIYRSFHTKVKKSMNEQDSLALLNFQMSTISISVKLTRQCYVLSKMTVADEPNQLAVYG